MHQQHHFIQLVEQLSSHLGSTVFEQVEGQAVFDYRSISFSFSISSLADPLLEPEHVEILLGLGTLKPASRLTALRKMAGHNIESGSPVHGIYTLHSAVSDYALARHCFPLAYLNLDNLVTLTGRLTTIHLPFKIAYCGDLAINETVAETAPRTRSSSAHRLLMRNAHVQ